MEEERKSRSAFFATYLLLVAFPAGAELEERLRATLSPDEACMISVCVMDVTKPFDSASLRSG